MALSTDERCDVVITTLPGCGSFTDARLVDVSTKPFTVCDMASTPHATPINAPISACCDEAANTVSGAATGVNVNRIRGSVM